MPFRLGPMELIIILVIVMMIFGIGKLPQVGSAIGKSLREFRKAQETDILDDTSEQTSATKKVQQDGGGV